MDTEYDLFEVFPGGAPLWRSCVRGRGCALAALEVMGKQTGNECFAAELGTESIIGRVNAGHEARGQSNSARGDS
jgi:hypothetical protein